MSFNVYFDEVSSKELVDLIVILKLHFSLFNYQKFSFTIFEAGLNAWIKQSRTIRSNYSSKWERENDSSTVDR